AAVLIAAGDDYSGTVRLYRTPLSPIIPAIPTGRVIEEPFKASVTDAGVKHPVTRNLPGTRGSKGEPEWGRWFRQVEVRPTSGNVIMKGAGNDPLLIVDRKGEGRVALLASDQAWLWARGFEGGGPHTDLLRRLSHWLMKEPDLEDERLIATATGLNLSLERRSMTDQVAPVRLISPGGETREVTLEPVEPGIWRTTLEVNLPGLYNAETEAAPPAGKLTAVAHAGAEDVREMSEVTATDQKLKPIIDATGGGSDRKS